MITLHDYQQDMIERTRVELRTHRSVLLQAPTGAGKTILAAHMCGTAARKGRRALFIVHRRELLIQTAKTFGKVGIPHGLIAAGITGDRRAPVQIALVNTLANRLDMFGSFDLVIPDEAHHVAATTWSKVIDHYAGAKVVGLSATPERLDGTGLGKWFQRMVRGPAVSWLIEHGYLSPYRLYAPSTPDLTGVQSRAGDYAREALSAAMEKPTLIGDAVEHYTRLARGKRAMVFCVSIKHSLAVVAKFQAAGYRAAHIDGETAPEERDRLIAAFVAGSIEVLSSVDLVSEGFDLPAIEVAILLRPTKSVSLYIQQVGRAIRIAPGKSEALILDHAGNALKHGLPDDDRDWSLEGRKKRKRGPAEPGDDENPVQVRHCPQCFHVHAPAPECPRCDHVYPVMGRTVKELAGELKEMQRAEAKQKRIEVGRAKSLEELITIGRMRGYKNPKYWAEMTMKSRNAAAEKRYGGLIR